MDNKRRGESLFFYLTRNIIVVIVLPRKGDTSLDLLLFLSFVLGLVLLRLVGFTWSLPPPEKKLVLAPRKSSRHNSWSSLVTKYNLPTLIRLVLVPNRGSLRHSLRSLGTKHETPNIVYNLDTERKAQHPTRAVMIRAVERGLVSCRACLGRLERECLRPQVFSSKASSLF